MVNAAFANVFDLHVFQVSLGRVWEMELERAEVEERFRRRMEQAETIITRVLQGKGFAVRRGIFDAAKACRVKGSPDGLWTWEGKGLEAEIVPDPATVPGR